MRFYKQVVVKLELILVAKNNKKLTNAYLSINMLYIKQKALIETLMKVIIDCKTERTRRYDL